MLERNTGSSRWIGRAGWLALALALGGVLTLAIRFDPANWPSYVGDEPTYLAAAQSLAYDLDLRFEAGDLQRFEQAGGRLPEALILQSPDDGATIYYSKPWIYPLLIAPAVRLAGHRGAVVWQGLLFALGAVLLGRRMNAEWQHLAPWVVVLWLFGSVTFAQVFWLHADLPLAGLVAAGLALGLPSRVWSQGPRMAQQLGGAPEGPGAAAGALGAGLLVLAAMARPFYAALLLPLWLDARGRRRRAGLVLGVVVALLLTLGGNFALQRSWSAYGAERLGFTPQTGFPLAEAARGADAPTSAVQSDGALSSGAVAGDAASAASGSWRAAVAARGSNAWAGPEKTLPFGFDLAEARWNALYLFLGRHVGLLPYFAGPLLLGLLACGGGWRRAAGLWLAFLVIAAAFLVTRPFNFWGGGGSLANRYLLPAIPALWFAASRRVHGAWLAIIAAVAAMFLVPLWKQPSAYLLNADATYRFVSTVARDRLLYETTQSSLKPAGREDFLLVEGPNELWAKPLSSSLVPHEFAPGRARRLTVDPADPGGHLLVADPVPLGGLVLQVLEGPQGGAKTWVELQRPRARHRMWWSSERVTLYEVDLAEGLRELGIEEPTAVRLRWRFAEG